MPPTLNTIGATPDTNDALPPDDLAAVYERTFRSMSAWLASRLRASADAEDLAQETFLRAISIRDGFRGESSAESWLFGIARNVLRHHFRSAAAHKRGGAFVHVALGEEDELAGTITPFDDVHALFDLADIRVRALQTVDEADWNLLAAHHVDDAPIEELARETSHSTSALKSRLHRARLRLEPALRELAG